MNQEDREREHKEAMAVFEVALQDYFDRNLNAAMEKLLVLADRFSLLEDYDSQARCYNCLGVIYNISGSDAMGMDCYLKGLKCAKEHGVYYVMLLCLNNIGNQYQKLSEYGKALGYFEECLKGKDYLDLVNSDRDRNFYQVVQENAAICHLKLGNLELSEHYLRSMTEQMGKESEVKTTYSMVKSLLDWKLGRVDQVIESLPKLEERIMNDTDSTTMMDSLPEYIALVKEMGQLEYWERILRFSYERVRDYRGTTMKLRVLEYCLDYTKIMDQQDHYQMLCQLYVQTSLENREEDRQERIQVADGKIMLFEQENEWIRIQKEKKVLQEAVEKDTLTGLGSRYSLHKYGRELIDKAKEEHSCLVTGLIDVDCFKEYNDTYGHVEGDKCLEQVAVLIKKTLEKAESMGASGRAFRYGGDEMLVIATGLNTEQIAELAGDLAAELNQLRIENRHSDVQSILSVSQGYYCQVPNESDTLEYFLKKADVELYKVKQANKNDYQITVGA